MTLREGYVLAENNQEKKDEQINSSSTNNNKDLGGIQIGGRNMFKHGFVDS